MASGLTTSTDMIYNGKEGTPWHSLGVNFNGDMTANDIDTLCPRFSNPVLKVPCELDGSIVPGHYFTIRSDDRTVLGHVGTEYQIMQNMEMARIAEKFVQDPNGPIFKTAGVLYNGRKSWILAKFPKDMIIKGRNGKEDVIDQYLLFSNSHDGSARMQVQMTPIRVVCQNTLNMAHKGKDKNTSAYVCHSGNIGEKLTNVSNILNIAAREFEQTKELYQALVSKEITKEQTETVLMSLFPADTTNAKNKRAKVLTLAEAGIGNADYAGTAWALYNGITELRDHHDGEGSKREDKADLKVDRAWFGNGVKEKARALSVITEVCLS